MDIITRVVGWMFVVGVALTLVLTLVALALRLFNLRTVDDKYLKPLFYSLILEIIGCVVFLFWSGFGNPTFEPAVGQGSIHLLNGNGEPLAESTTMRLGKRALYTFEPIDPERLVRNSPKSYEEASPVPSASCDLNSDQQYHLGMYLSQLRPGSTERIDPLAAKDHLVAFMRSEDASRAEKGQAIARLFFLLDELVTCSEFSDVATWTQDYRRRAGITMFEELGEIHLEAANRPDLLDESQREAVRSATLGHFLQYLAAASRDNPELQTIIARVWQRSEELAGCPNDGVVCSALEASDRATLKKIGKELGAGSAATTFACAS